MPLKPPLTVTIAVFLLTFIVWIFFYVMDMRLNPPATVLVAAVMLALVGAVRWLWSRAHAKRGTK
jgi:protein-S-isoprenylcysteine O-methyltransferase Ste14